MNNLLPFDLIDTPFDILGTPMRTRIETLLLAQVQSAAITKTPLDSKVKKHLSHYPTLLADLLTDPSVSNVLGVKDRGDLLGNDTSALNALLLNYEELSPILEPRLLDNLEAVQQIYLHCWRTQMQGTKSMDELAEILREDPNRTLYVAKFTEKRELALKLQRESEDLKYRSPAWAFFYLSSHPIDHDLPLDRELLQVLQGDEEYLYRAAHLLKNRTEMRPLVWKPLVSKLSSPRWVYHAMSAGIAEGHEDEFYQILYRAPQWGCQLIASSEIEDVSVDELHFHYMAMNRAACNHELIQELHYWHKSMINKLALSFRQAS